MAKLSSVVWKVVILNMLMMAIAAVNANLEETNELLDESSSGGRFGLQELVAGRRLLNNLNLCGSHGCKRMYPRWKDPQCCRIDRIGRVCTDVGENSNSHCGACNKRCSYGLTCCNGRCIDVRTDRNNCGRCGTKCRHNKPCRRGMCGY